MEENQEIFVENQDELVEKPKSQRKANIIFFIVVGILLTFIAVNIYLFTTVFFRVSVQGNSMTSTLSNGDVLIVNRKADVERGDVVIINKHKENYTQTVYSIENRRIDLTTLNYPCIRVVDVEEWFSENQKYKSLAFTVDADGKSLTINDNISHQIIKIVYETEYTVVKRVIGLEGDSIKIENGKVLLKKAGESTFKVLQEDYLDEHIFTTPIEGYQKEWTVGKGEVFYLGDNRINSEDSRSDGCSKLENVEGVVSNFSIWIKPVTTWFGKLFS